MRGQDNTHVVGLSGGADSTALALRMSEVWPDLDVTYFCSPTGDELPEMVAHWEKLECLLGQPIVKATNGTLDSWIRKYRALPNSHMRWCTRLLKIEPCSQYLATLENPILYVGLRFDEPTREGILTSDYECRFPLREWGWTRRDVLDYLKHRGVTIPRRTDCARCYGQRLSEWYTLRRDYPTIWKSAVEQERWVTEERGKEATFRSASRDTWPAGLDELGREFDRRYPRGYSPQVPLFELETEDTGCRVCKL
jgi:3'-phosphoadenosine 5'-phosphosulfate sulfotransferase (PAPS reductase)/FAD synthetase